MSVGKDVVYIGKIPVHIWGEPSSVVYLYVHGQGGNKEEAALLADIICRHGAQVLSIDLPEHGERKDEEAGFDPWIIVPELHLIMNFVKRRWSRVSLYAVSIGAWFSMQSLGDEPLQNCLFVSPVVDMAQLIEKMMKWAGVTEKQLEEEREIETSFGQTLSWDYWKYAVEHPITSWKIPTEILHGEKDDLTDYDTIRRFSDRFHCDLTFVKNGGHWLHSEEEHMALRKWILRKTGSCSTAAEACKRICLK